MTNGEIVNKLELLNKIGSYKLPISVMWKITRNIQEFSKIAKLYDEERIKIVKKYAELDDDGQIKETSNGAVFKNQEVHDACIAEIMELLNEDNPDLTIRKVKIEDLIACDSDKFDALDMSQLYGIEFMVEE